MYAISETHMQNVFVEFKYLIMLSICNDNGNVEIYESQN